MVKPFFIKSVFAVLSALLLSQCSYTQNSGQVISGIGFKGGLAYSTYTYEEGALKSPFWRYGFTAGIFADKLRTQDYSLQLEADFEQKGANFKQNSNDPDSYFTLNMLAIPFTIRFFLLRGQIRPYFGAGPRVDFLLNKNDPTTPSLFISTRSITFGGTIVAGVQFRLSRRYLTIIEASYSPDLTNFMDYQFLEPYDHIVTRNYAWELKTGIMFDMMKK